MNLVKVDIVRAQSLQAQHRILQRFLGDCIARRQLRGVERRPELAPSEVWVTHGAEEALLRGLVDNAESRMLLERYRSLVELEEGNRTGPPQYDPAAGALIEAYKAVGLEPQLSGKPEDRSQ